MKKVFYYVSIAIVLGFSSQASSDVIYYVGAISVKGVTVPAKATHEDVEYLVGPKIKIKYKISGKDYLSVYMSSFGDMIAYGSPRSIIVYNESADKKQNYYFQGKEVSWFRFLWWSN